MFADGSSASQLHIPFDSSGAIVLDDRSPVDGSGRTFIFTDPRGFVAAHSPEEVHNALCEIDALQRRGFYLAGYISYDAGLVLDKPVISRHKCDVPLVWLGVYDSAAEIDCRSLNLDFWDPAAFISEPRLNVSEIDYIRSVEAIKNYIGAGDVYQVNYTCRLLFENKGKPSGLFARLRRAHPVCHCAFINAGDFQVISLSPELFLRRCGNVIISRPMKGTARRGASSIEDERLAEHLSLDEKNRAENLMIVDLMRNDIGRISVYGGVCVDDLFRVEKYRSVFQMTSEVSGIIRDGMQTSDILKASFPPGSVTGAPKIRAVEIIDEIESNSRGVYCGCVGMFKPDGDFLLSVAIRTIVQMGRKCEMGVGSGIVADSEPSAEFQEVMLKGEFLRAEPVDFQLLETMLYRAGEGYVLLDEHLARIKRSADYFGWRFDKERVIDALDGASHEINCESARVRLLVSEGGEPVVEWSALDAGADLSVKLLLMRRRLDRNNAFLYHKTTNRSIYDEDLNTARSRGCFDVLYFDGCGEISECAASNVILEIDGKRFTPPIGAGVLPGIWRDKEIAAGRLFERAITLEDLRSAERVFICNSVRGEIEVRAVEDLNGEIVWRSAEFKQVCKIAHTEET